MSAAHDRDPESTISRTEIPVSDETRAAFGDVVARLIRCEVAMQRTDKPVAEAFRRAEDLLRLLDAMDEPSAHHRPRLNELLRCAREGLLA